MHSKRLKFFYDWPTYATLFSFLTNHNNLKIKKILSAIKILRALCTTWFEGGAKYKKFHTIVSHVYHLHSAVLRFVKNDVTFTIEKEKKIVKFSWQCCQPPPNFIKTPAS